MVKRLTIMLFAICIFISIAGCSNSAGKITIGFVPSNNPENMLSNFKPISAYLEKEMKVTIDVIIPDDYKGLIDGMKQKKIDIGWYGAFSYITAEKEIDLEPLVIQYRKGFGTSYHSLIITNRKSGINKVEHLKGKRFAFVDPESTSGFIIPSALFMSRNIEIQKYFSEIIYSGTHNDVVLDVLSGNADAGAIEDLTYYKMISDGKFIEDDLPIIWKSDDIPGSPFVCRADIDEHLKEKFKSTMLNISKKDPEAVKKFDSRIEKYVEFDDSLYNGIRNIATILGDDFVTQKFMSKK